MTYLIWQLLIMGTYLCLLGELYGTHHLHSSTEELQTILLIATYCYFIFQFDYFKMFIQYY